jgi:hypothetical protein
MILLETFLIFAAVCVGAFYLIPEWLLLSTLIQLGCLAFSFVTTVFLR